LLASALRRPSMKTPTTFPSRPKSTGTAMSLSACFCPQSERSAADGLSRHSGGYKKPLPLKKDEKGVWSLTVGPLPPGFYIYGFAIDGGLRMPDPSNPNLEVRRWGPTSLFVVPGSDKAVFEERRVPHGTIHINFY